MTDLWKRLVLSALVGGFGCLVGYVTPHLGSIGLLHRQSLQTPTQAQVQPLKSPQTSTQAQGGASVASLAAVSPMPGRVAPDFTLADNQGKEHRLSEYRGKPVLVNFWASWCGYCKQEMPALREAASHYQGKMQFVGINIADQDQKSAAQAFLQQYHIQYPTLFDQTGEVSERYLVRVVPTTLLRDGRGVIVERIQGPLTLDKLDELLKKVSV